MKFIFKRIQFKTTNQLCKFFCFVCFVLFCFVVCCFIKKLSLNRVWLVNSILIWKKINLLDFALFCYMFVKIRWKVEHLTIVILTINFNLVWLCFWLSSIKWNVALVELNLGRGFCSNNVMLKIQKALLNGITYGQRETDYNNQLIIISQWMLASIRCERVIWDLSIQINLLPLTNWSHYPQFH